MISQKVLQMMRQVDSHISKKERLKALSVIEDITIDFDASPVKHRSN